MPTDCPLGVDSLARDAIIEYAQHQPRKENRMPGEQGRITTTREFVMLVHNFTLVLMKEHRIHRSDSRIKEFNKYIHEGAHTMIEAQEIRGVDPMTIESLIDWSLLAFKFHFPECETLRIVTNEMVKEDEDELREG